MITDAIVGGFLGIVRALLTLIPEWAPDGDVMSGAGGSFGSLMWQWNGYYPVTTTVLMLLAVLTFWLASLVWSTVVHLWQQLPFT